MSVLIHVDTALLMPEVLITTRRLLLNSFFRCPCLFLPSCVILTSEMASALTSEAAGENGSNAKLLAWYRRTLQPNSPLESLGRPAALLKTIVFQHHDSPGRQHMCQNCWVSVLVFKGHLILVLIATLLKGNKSILRPLLQL